jgi:hypothetical protein
MTKTKSNVEKSVEETCRIMKRHKLEGTPVFLVIYRDIQYERQSKDWHTGLDRYKPFEFFDDQSAKGGVKKK